MVGVAAASVTAIALLGFAQVNGATLPTPTFDGKPVQSPPLSPFTKEQAMEKMNKIQDILTPYGDFIRVDKIVDLPADQVTQNKSDLLINPNIVED